MKLPVAILAGGLATRLRPLTEKIPKALVEVAGEPFVFHQLKWLAQQRISHVVMCVGFMGDMVREKVGSGERWGIRVDYSFDGNILLGTGGALQKALPFLGERFFVFYGDSYLPIDFLPIQQAFFASGKPALMTFLKNEGRWDKSNVRAENGKLITYNKRSPDSSMQHIDYGLGVLSDLAFQGRRSGEVFDLADLYEELAEKQQLAGFEVVHRFYEIGSKQGLAETHDFLVSKKR